MFDAGRGEAPADLAMQLSALQDGFSTGGEFENSFCESGSFQLSQGEGRVADSPQLSALGNFEEGLTVFDAVAEEESFESTLVNPLSKAVADNEGTPWPTPYTPPDFVTGTADSIPSKDLGLMGTHEWEYQAQLTKNITSLSGLGTAGEDDDVLFDRPTYASLEGLGALAQARPADPRVGAYRKVVVAAATAGGKEAARVARELAAKSQKIAGLADDRARAVAQAREGFKRALREVDQLDHSAKLLATQLLDDNGEPRADTTLTDIARLKKLRERAISLGRRAVRYQKTNALATPLAENGIAQAAILQMLSAAVLAGDVGTAAALGAMYDEIGKKSGQIRSIRQKQLAKWEKKSELDGILGDISEQDPYEADINAIELADLQALAGLEGRLWRKFKRTVKKGAKKVGRGVKRTVKKGVRTIKSGARSVKRGVREVGKVSRRAARAAFVTPTKGTFRAAKALARGNVKKAFRAVGSSVRSSAKDIANVAGKTLLDFPCRLASTKLGMAAIRTGGAAVGAAYGGTKGAAVGKEAGRQAAIMNKSVCGGLRKVGITKGTFRPGQVKGAFKGVAKKLWKTSLSPQAAFRAGKNVLRNLATGSGASPTDLLNKFGADTLKKLGTKGARALAKEAYQRGQRELVSQAKKQGRRLVRRTVRRVAQQAAQQYLPAPIAQAAQYAQGARGFVQDPRAFVQQQARNLPAQLPAAARNLPRALAPTAARALPAAAQGFYPAAQQYLPPPPPPQAYYPQPPPQQYLPRPQAYYPAAAAPQQYLPQPALPPGMSRRFIPPGQSSGAFRGVNPAPQWSPYLSGGF